MTQLPPLLNVTQVAKALCCDRRTVNRWVKIGKLDPVELPSGLLRFHREDIEAILARKRNRPAA